MYNKQKTLPTKEQRKQGIDYFDPFNSSTFQSKSRNIDQTSTWLCLAKGEKYISLTNPRNNLNKSMYKF